MQARLPLMLSALGLQLVFVYAPCRCSTYVLVVLPPSQYIVHTVVAFV
jgi:hypothetical protein